MRTLLLDATLYALSSAVHSHFRTFCSTCMNGVSFTGWIKDNNPSLYSHLHGRVCTMCSLMPACMHACALLCTHAYADKHCTYIYVYPTSMVRTRMYAGTYHRLTSPPLPHVRSPLGKNHGKSQMPFALPMQLDSWMLSPRSSRKCCIQHS